MNILRSTLSRLRLTCAIAAAVGGVAAANQEAAATAYRPAGDWRFQVFLDGKPIGFHRFELSENGTQRHLLSEARFNVKFLFISAYRYVHESRESWQGECLTAINARTDDNGKQRLVTGAQYEADFSIATGGSVSNLGQCVMSFAYWNPRILVASRLLNPQTGEYVPVDVTRVGAEILTARGNTQPSEHYRIAGRSTDAPMQIDLWYSTSMEWLALESKTQDGRTLRYQIQ